MRTQLSGHPTGLQDVDAHVPLGDLLMQVLGEPVHAELGDAVHAVAVPRDAAAIELMFQQVR
jgi:hypothetical protein